jgi:hypothetical protein
MKTLSPIAAVVIVVAAAGCARQDGVDFESIAARPAPEMSSTANRSVDIDANYAYMRNTNYRAAWDDLQRMIYIDNPSRLSPFPNIDMSGNPR